MLMKQIIYIILFLLSFSLSIQAGESTLSIEEANKVYSTIEESGLYASDATQSRNLPLGIKKTMGNIPFTIALCNATFHQEYSEVNIYVKIEVPQSSRSLLLGAENIKLSSDNGLIGDVHLLLLQEVPIPMGNAGKIVFGGGFDKEKGITGSLSYVVLDCNFQLKEVHINGEVILNDQVVVPADKKSKNTQVKAPFGVHVSDFNDLLFSVSFPPMELVALPGMVIEMQGATLDMSDTRNPERLSAPGNYFKEYVLLPDINTWRGLYVEKFKLSLPEEFRRRGSEQAISIEANSLILDENGLTTQIATTGLLSIDEGDAGGWPFSVEKFYLSFLANNLTGLGFEGNLQLPVSPETCRYKAIANLGGDYLIEASLPERLNTDIFGDGIEMFLEKTSFVRLEKKGSSFIPALVLDGEMAFKNKALLKMDKFIFRRLSFSASAPYLSVERFDYDGEVSFNGIPATIDQIGLSCSDSLAAIHLRMKLNLMEGKIAAGTSAEIIAAHRGGKWKYKQLKVNEINLDNVCLPGFTLSGQLEIREDDPNYGNYFGGNISATFSALHEGLSIRSEAKFGRKDDFRYWYLEGSAQFPGGIPVAPPAVLINGFHGGAYYRMKAKGEEGNVYYPDKSSGLGVRAGVSFMIGNEKAVNGDAILEMAFLSSGGLGKISFYGRAAFLSGGIVSGNKLAGLYRESVSQAKEMGKSLAENLPKNINDSKLAQLVYPRKSASEKAGKDALSAFMTMDYDFVTKTFDANFEVSIYIAGGLIKGINADHVAGWARIYASPQEWYTHIGTPERPVGIHFGFGPFSLKTKSYFMVGTHIPPAPAPPRQVAEALKISSEDADYMKLLNVIGDGRGFAFGSNVAFDTGNLSFLILYARFQAEMGFDVMLKDYTGYICKETGSVPGINGWYANGQAYTFLQGELGVRIRLMFLKLKIPIIKGTAAVLLQTRLPSPSWFGGYMGLDLNVLGGLISGNMRMKFSFGDDCELVRADGEYSPVDMPMIADLSPTNDSKEVDVFTSPQATFTMGIGKAFTIEDEEGSKTFRIRLKDFYVQYADGKKIDGRLEWNEEKDRATFFSKEILPPNSRIRASVSVNFEQAHEGAWQVVSQDGREASETKTVLFQTGEAPDHIPFSNIAYAYPVIHQKNFFPGEGDEGYVQLNTGQVYLFPNTFEYVAHFVSSDGTEAEAVFTYDPVSSRLYYRLPSLRNKEAYQLELSARPARDSGSEQLPESAFTSLYEEDEYVAGYARKMAQKMVNTNRLSILEYTFSSSRFNTFAEKIASMRLSGKHQYVSIEIRSLFLETDDVYETFDLPELSGTVYTGGKPLVQAQAILSDAYYREDIAPLLYNWYPDSGLRLSKREEAVYGVPPVRAFTFYDGYLHMVSSETPNLSLRTKLPFVYQLPAIYTVDYYDLRDQVANKYVGSGQLKDWAFLINSQLKFIRQGKYRASYQYIMPGNKKGTKTEVEYENNIDWR